MDFLSSVGDKTDADFAAVFADFAKRGGRAKPSPDPSFNPSQEVAPDAAARCKTPAFLQTPLRIGKVDLPNRVWLAPMAGIADKPFRRVCKAFGAGHAVSEMIIADTALYARKKSLSRANFDGESGPIAAQIAGADPKKLAQAARFQAQAGAAIVDINMGCPAKKVCKKLAGSALLQDEDLVKRLLDAAIEAVSPLGACVTLKTRLGFANGAENVLRIAQIAENAGVAAIAIHGRTREDFYKGSARYELIGEVKKQSKIPVIVNGDIDSPEKALQVQAQTGADAVMIGRAAQGRPWLFYEIAQKAAGKTLLPPCAKDIKNLALLHLQSVYAFYGEYSGCRMARKHIAWYTNALPCANAFRQAVYGCENTAEQYKAVERFFDDLIARGL